MKLEKNKFISIEKLIAFTSNGLYEHDLIVEERSSDGSNEVYKKYNGYNDILKETRNKYIYIIYTVKGNDYIVKELYTLEDYEKALNEDIKKLYGKKITKTLIKSLNFKEHSLMAFENMDEKDILKLKLEEF